jgi:CheY-like chemotaxis protein
MPAAVVIGASDLLPALVSQAGIDEDDALTFPDTEPLQALQAITEQQPPVVVLERLFAATSRGAALINRLKNDPALADVQIRVLSHSGDYSRVITRPAHAQVSAMGGATIAEPPPAPPPPKPEPAPAAAPIPPPAPKPAPSSSPEPEPRLDWHGTRRSPRYRARDGLEIQLDGNPVTVVDVSTIGAQVLSANMVRPDQRVRVTVPRGEQGPLRFRATIAWARFELPRRAGDPGPHYRVGIEFLDADSDTLERFCQDNKA